MAEKTVYIIDLNDKVTPKLRGVQAAAKQTDKSVLGVGKAFSYGGLAAGAGLAALAGIAKGIWDITAGAEMTKTSFTVMLGSADKATKMIGDIRKFAAETPFETSDLEQSANTLMGFGVEGTKVMGIMKMLGDVSGGNADRFQRLSLVFAQTQSAGKLMGQDLLQYINAGFNPLKQISKDTGIEMSKLRTMMSDGIISSDMVNEAFKNATSEGGIYFNLLEKQSHTLSGRLSTLVDNVKLMGLAVGESNMGALHGMLTLIQTIMDNVEPLKDLLVQMFQPLAQIQELFKGFSGGGSLVLLFFKMFATQLQLALIPTQLLVAQLFTLFDLIKSIITLDFDGFMDRTLDRYKKPFTTFGDIWTSEKSDGKSMPQQQAMAAWGGMGIGGGGVDKFSGADTKWLDSLKGGGADVYAAARAALDAPKKGKGKKETAGGITLTESKNGVTHIIFNIDKFQNNEFNEGKNTQVPDDIQLFLDKMKLAMNTVLNDAQIGLNVG